MESTFQKSKSFFPSEFDQGDFVPSGKRWAAARRAKMPLQKLAIPQSRKADAEEAKQIMEVQGCHRRLLCRQAGRKQVGGYSGVVVDAGSVRKKVSFERRGEAEGKGRKEKASVVITLPAKSEKMATKGTQTDFRESGTQTFPWKHEIRSGGKLLGDLLALDSFHLKENFPPGVEEVTLIERARQKLAWENVIDRLRGKENELKRKSLVLRMAANESSGREAKKDEENRERLEMSAQQMRDVRRSLEEKLQARLQRSYGRRKRENRAKINCWNHQLSRRIRQAKAARRRPPEKVDVIALHGDGASDLYAPKLRSGRPWPRHEVIDIRCGYLKRFHGLEILEKRMTDILDPRSSVFAAARFTSKSKKPGMSWRKFVEKVADEPKEKKLASISLKIAVPAPTPEPPTGGPSDSEGGVLPASPAHAENLNGSSLPPPQ